MSENFGNGPGTITIGDKTLLVAMAPDAVATSMARWLKQEFQRTHNPLTKIVEAIKGLDSHLQTLAMKAAVQEQLRTEPTVEERAELLATPKAAGHLLWLLARDLNPGLTLEDVAKLVTESNFESVWNQINQISGLK